MHIHLLRGVAQWGSRIEGVFEMATQSAPNCKQKTKRKQKNRRRQKSQACDFCLLLFNQRTVCDDNVRVFTAEACLFQVVTICIQ